MPWDPMRDLLTMQERLESLFGSATTGWMPPVDLSESPDRYVLTIELPGLPREGVTIDVREGTLTVSGHRPADSCCPDRYLQLERGQGRFSRAFRFAADVDAAGVTADLANGVLTVVVPKLVPSKSRQITVT